MKLKILAALILVGTLAACTTYGASSPSSNVFDPVRSQNGGPMGSSGGGPN
ncbi:MAG: hypothetical protein Q8Q73_07840 [Stagnimonas sp.]|jgi:hypothetical protein|nr:hypothetical protein [Stagnimonas sp.]